jgi:hypothetical protein
VTLSDVERPQARVPSSKLKDVSTLARPHLSKGEFQELEDLNKYEDVFAGIMKTIGGLTKCITI